MAHAHWKRAFYTITAGQTVSLVGSSAVQFALIWWLSAETDSPMMLALAGLLAFLPQMVLGPFAGVWIDRWRRKTVVLAADLFQGTVAAAFAVWFFAGTPPYWAACVVLGVRAVGGVFHTPAIQALVPLLVPGEQLLRANSVSQFLQSGAFLLGPVLGAALYSALPMGWVLMTDLLGAAAACGTVACVAVREPAAVRRRPAFGRELREGLETLRADRQLLAVLLCSGAAMVFYMPLSSYYPLMSSGYFAVSSWHGSLVELLYALGMMLAAAALGACGQLRRPLQAAGLGLAVVSATVLVSGLLPPTRAAFWGFAAACGLMGAGANLYGIPVTAYMQRTIPPEKLGRAFSLMGSLMSLAMPVGLVLSGPVAERYGVPLWFLITGLASGVCAAVCLAVLAAARRRAG